MASMILDQYFPFQAFALPNSYISMLPECDSHSLYYGHDEFYVNATHSLNQLVTMHRLTDYSLVQLLTSTDINLPALQLARLRDAAGSVYNHQLYFDELTCTKGQPPVIRVTEAIIAAYGSIENFRRMMIAAATSVVGSGWVWLVFENNRGLHIATTANNDTVDLNNVTPILNLDMWEHAFIRQEPFNRGNYVDTWFGLVNWGAAETRYMSATGQADADAGDAPAATPAPAETALPAASAAMTPAT